MCFTVLHSLIYIMGNISKKGSKSKGESKTKKLENVEDVKIEQAAESDCSVESAPQPKKSKTKKLEDVKIEQSTEQESDCSMEAEPQPEKSPKLKKAKDNTKQVSGQEIFVQITHFIFSSKFYFLHCIKCRFS